MINCKTASNDTCGKGKKCCCFFCEEKETCDQCCPDVQDGTVKEPMEDCNDAYEFQPPKTLEEAIPEVLDDITKVALVIKKQEAKQDEFKEKILQVMNQVITQGFQIGIVDNFIRSLDVIEDVKFENYSQYNNMIMDAKEAVDTQGLEFLLNYSKNNKGFSKFEIKEVYEK